MKKQKNNHVILVKKQRDGAKFIFFKCTWTSPQRKSIYKFVTNHALLTEENERDEDWLDGFCDAFWDSLVNVGRGSIYNKSTALLGGADMSAENVFKS